MRNEYKNIVSHYEECFLKHGDNHKGVDWPNQPDLDKRFKVAFDLTRENRGNKFSLLDFGCGNALFVDYLTQHDLLSEIDYTGLDLSDLFISCSQKKYPHLNFVSADILKSPHAVNKQDYIIMNGVLTIKSTLNFEAMWEYTQRLLTILFEKCNVGMAFNIMSAHVDWRRDDLFHLEFDTLAQFLQKNLTRNYIFRNDYGLYEYTTYVYR
jgi:hypothetical protein